MHKDFIAGVKNLWKWFPVIWKDRNWDHTFIYEILKTKIEFQAKYIGNMDRHTTAKQDAEKMRLVARLIKLQQEGYYDMEYMDYHEQDMSFIEVLDKPDSHQIVFKQTSERFDEYFAKYPRQYKRVLSGDINRFGRPRPITDKQVIAMEIAHENQSRCQKLIFGIIHDGIESWWC